MPMVTDKKTGKKKKFPYTPAGMKAAKQPKKKKPRWFIPLDKVFNIYSSEDDYVSYNKRRVKRNILNEDK